MSSDTPDTIDLLAPLGFDPSAGQYITATTQEIAGANNMTVHATRYHLGVAIGNGLVKRVGRILRRGVGQPPIGYMLTAEGRRLRGEYV